MSVIPLALSLKIILFRLAKTDNCEFSRKNKCLSLEFNKLNEIYPNKKR